MRIKTNGLLGIGVTTVVGLIGSLFGAVNAYADYCGCGPITSCWQAIPASPQTCASYNGQAYEEINYQGNVVGSGTLSNCVVDSYPAGDPGYPSACRLKK